MRRFLVLAMVAVMAVPVLASAQAGPGKGPHGMGKMDYINELNLTKEQLMQIKELQRESRKKAVEVRSKIQIKRIDFDDEAQKDKPDMKLMGKLIDELTALHAQQYKAMLESRMKMMGLLTPEQKQKLSERSLMGPRGQMMGMEDDMPPGPMPGSGPGGMPLPPPGN